MKNNWPETIGELLEECQRLISENDLYTLGERGEPFSGETEPRVDGTEYLAGEYQYGIAMIPAQWVTHVIDAAALGGGECENVSDEPQHFQCSKCIDRGIVRKVFDNRTRFSFCPDCGAKVRKAVK